MCEEHEMLNYMYEVLPFSGNGGKQHEHMYVFLGGPTLTLEACEAGLGETRDKRQLSPQQFLNLWSPTDTYSEA